MLQDRKKLKRQLLVHLEIDGEEKIQKAKLSQKLYRKIYQQRAQLDRERLKLQGDQQKQLNLLLSAFKQPNILKQVTWGKMLARSFKISTYINLNLAKIGINSYKAKVQQSLKQLGAKIKHEVELQVLHAMVGDSLPEELRQKKLKDLRQGHYNDQIITLMPGYKVNLDLQDSEPSKAITKTVKQIGQYLYHRYMQRLKTAYNSIDIQKQALKMVEEDGIVFLDEIDKLAVPQGPGSNFGKGVSTEGVQRDLLPLIQGTMISTKFGDIKTDHILFIASGSFSMAKVQDLIPELLGRLPIRVNLSPLTKQQLVRILKQPQFNLILQQQKLLQTQKVKLIFTEDAILEIADQAFQMNLNKQNLGARRLHAIIEKVVSQISFNAPKYKGKQFIIDSAYVKEKLKYQIQSIDLGKFLL